MYKQTATNLATAPAESVHEWINSFDTVLSDCDGVLWSGSHAIPGSCDVIKRLKELGKKVFLVTNAPVKSRNQLQKFAESFGYCVSKEEIVSAGYTTAKYLADLKFTKKVYLIGTEGLAMDLKELGIQYIQTEEKEIPDGKLFSIIANGLKLDDEVGAVIVSFDHKFNYVKLLEASNYLRNPECLFIATSDEEVYPTAIGTVIPSIGPHLRALENVSGRSATIIGKPDPNMCQSIREMTNIVPERTLMIGDSAKQDMLIGVNCGFQTMLVGTGLNNMNDVRNWQNSDDTKLKELIPDVYLPKLADLLPFVNEHI